MTAAAGPGRALRAPAYVLSAAAMLLVGATPASCAPGDEDLPPPTTFTFTLDHAETTSAGVFDPQGRLLRTLWRGLRFDAGRQSGTWDGADDAGQPLPGGRYEVRVAHHRMRYEWEGVVGNSSAVLTGAQVHRAYLPLSAIAIVGPRAHVASRYNEQQPGIRSFDLAAPNLALPSPVAADPFAGIAMLASDGPRLYWANIGGLSPTSFVGATDLTRPGARVSFPRGQAVCLNRTVGKLLCAPGQDYAGVIDVQTIAASQPTGLAVQTRGRVLAVAHGHDDVVRLFDKGSGLALGQIDVPLAADRLNQIAMSPGGDLWVITSHAGARSTVRRYIRLEGVPVLAAEIDGLTAPLAVTVGPGGDDEVWIADGGASQQLKQFDRFGRPGRVIGRAGGLAADPTVSDDRLCFDLRPGLPATALAVADDGAVWVVDTCNNRLMRHAVDGRAEVALAMLPASYASTVDHANPRRVFANFLEFDVDDRAPLQPGMASWRLVRNWLAGLPDSLRDAASFNAQFGGFLSVETLANGRTYGLLTVSGRTVIVELPPEGPLRVVKVLAAPAQGATGKVLYENGDLGYSLTGPSTQSVWRLPVLGFNGADPVWATDPKRIASVPVGAGTPHARHVFSGLLAPRFPVTDSGHVVFFDPSVVQNEGFHLGAAALGSNQWLWQASPSGVLDGRGSFQTRRHDRTIQYGGNAVWASGRHVVYGFHGEFHTDALNGRVGQANQFMHFLDDGLFVGQFGVSSTRATGAADPGAAGNSFSPTLVRSGDRLYLYHNDEFTHGGVHRWRLDGWRDVGERRGTGAQGATIELR